MVKVFTIKEGVPISTYGFERSQLARQEIFKSLQVEQEIVLTNLDNFVPNFVETLEKLGFENFYHVILINQIWLDKIRLWRNHLFRD